VERILEAESRSPEEPCPLHVIEAPVERGLVVDWDAMTDVLEQLYSQQLGVSSKEHPVLMAESPINTNYLREKFTEIMFENFEVPAFHLQDSSVLSLRSVGLDTGVVVESGHGCTYTSVVHEGAVIRHTIPKTFYAGNDVTKYIARMLGKFSECEGEDLNFIAKDIKEKLCFVSEDFPADLRLAKDIDLYERTYNLPNGKQITLNAERMYAGEGMFRPEMFGCNCPGIHRQVCRTLRLADPTVRRAACSNIVMSGGNTLFPGMLTRLQMELNRIIPSSLGARVLDFPEQQQYATWIGGSRMAADPAMDDVWIMRADYDEQGPAIVNYRHKSCKHRE